MKNGLYYIQKLDMDDIVAIDSLEKHCILTHNIHFKIDPQVLTEEYSKSYNILYYTQNVLKGYASLNCFDSEELECTIIVENDKEIFGVIYNMILEKAMERKLKKLLFIIDTNDVFLVNIIKGLGFQFSFVEYRMNYEKTELHWDKDNSIILQDAVCDDIEAIAYLEQYSYSKPIEPVEIKEIANTNISNVKLAKLNDEIIGKMKVEDINGIVGIYGFVVDPKWRNQGYGRKILDSVIKELLDKDLKKLYLEVEAQNSIALHLYKAVGFQIQTKFDYYEYNIVSDLIKR